MSPNTFLRNNDINITAPCFLVDFSSGVCVVGIHALPCFWSFIFQDNSDRVIQPVNTINVGEHSRRTCVRIAYKAFQLEECLVDFSLANIDATSETIAATGKDNFDAMKVWEEYRFHEYQCNKCSTHFIIAKNHVKVNCAVEGCTAWSNKNCGHKMCKKCCVKHVAASGKESSCTIKEHKAPAPLSAVGDDTEVTGTRDSVPERH